ATLGIYSVAVALAETMFYLPEVASQIQRPDLLRAEKQNAAADAAFGLRITLIATIASGIALIALAPLLVNGLFGSEFSDATAQLRVLVPGAIGVATVKLLSSALVSQNHPLASSIAIAFSLATTITLDLLLIPAHGGMGAAIASTTAYWVGGLLTAVVFVRIFKISPRLLLPGASDVRALVTPVREKLAARGAN
ncbi:MAG: polysaccharide biosynthesis C-terminal domain-containing protein, partial [Thermoleophilaceae bacterium]|nr:polysaccharide biosynthesis C-terminal domain-containing protein [Thermoleophilaceae bacterium]